MISRKKCSLLDMSLISIPWNLSSWKILFWRAIESKGQARRIGTFIASQWVCVKNSSHGFPNSIEPAHQIKLSFIVASFLGICYYAGIIKLFRIPQLEKVHQQLNCINDRWGNRGGGNPQAKICLSLLSYMHFTAQINKRNREMLTGSEAWLINILTSTDVYSNWHAAILKCSSEL